MSKTENTETQAGVKKRHTVSTTLDSETFEAFDALSWKLKIRKPADLVRRAITEFVGKHGTVDGGEAPRSAK